jgi:hypothetical protein
MKRLIISMCLLVLLAPLYGADIRVTWTQRPAAESATGYNIYRDAVKVGSVPATTAEYIDKSVPAGQHAYTVTATDMWGEGPASDPASTSPGVGKVTGVAIEVLSSAVITGSTLSIIQAVASIQMDLTTTGTVTLAPAVVAAGKSLSTSTVGGKLRVVIFGLNQSTFSGAIATVSAPVTAVSGVTAADAAGQAVAVTVSVQ